jgi:phosphomannomutase / phosphoglucomutase
MIKIPSHVFRAYDIRGKAGIDITEDFCRNVGKGFGSILREIYKKENPTVIVGRDARTHSPSFEKALIEGLISVGCHVKTIGQTPSPVNYFALCNFGCDGSVQITASHNPKDDNGLKLQIRDAEAFAGNDLQKLRERIENDEFESGKGTSEELDAITPYIDKVTSLIKIDQPLKIVADFGNGVAGPVYSEALKKAGIELIELYAEPDGTFPNHIADPSNYETLTDLISAVKKEKANCGIAFDGDGDRVGFVDESGKIISADYALLLLAEDHLSRNPKASIIYTVSMSSILGTEVERLGGKSHMCVVGHSFVEHAMREHGSNLGGEQSGHFFCGENFFDHDDALVAALRILSILSSSSPLLLSSLIEKYPKVYQSPEWRPHCDDDKKSEVIRRITEYFQKDYSCITIDGVRIDFGEGAWAAIRQSNTSPKISICMEARSQEKLADVEKLVRAHIGAYEEIV